MLTPRSIADREAGSLHHIAQSVCPVLLVILFSGFAFAAGGPATDKGLPPDRQSPVKADHFNERPVIDGKLDEEVWRTAGVLKDFFQTEPGDNVKPPHSTEVRIGYDAKTLYIGIHATDQPGQVRSTVAKRDDLSGNDYVAVWL